MAATKKYLETYFAEQSKVIPGEPFDFMSSNGDKHIMSYGIVIDTILSCPEDEGLKKIADTIRLIDFKDGDLGHYLRHLGRGIAENC